MRRKFSFASEQAEAQAINFEKIGVHLAEIQFLLAVMDQKVNRKKTIKAFRIRRSPVNGLRKQLKIVLLLFEDEFYFVQLLVRKKPGKQGRFWPISGLVLTLARHYSGKCLFICGFTFLNLL